MSLSKGTPVRRGQGRARAVRGTTTSTEGK